MNVCNICKRLPPDQRRRVSVIGYGNGEEEDHIMCGDALIGVRVAFDGGFRQTFAPDQILPAPVMHRAAVVIPFPTRLRLIAAERPA